MKAVSLSQDSLKFKTQSHPEEVANSLSHGVAAILSIIGTAFLVALALRNDKPVIDIISIAFFGIGFITVYVTSFLFHTMHIDKAKKVLQILDHCMINIMITGSYAPVCLGILKGFWGYGIFAVNFICMVIGIVVNLIDAKKYYKLSQVLYIIMGWMFAVALYPAFKAIPVPGMLLIILGGVLYTIGIPFYRMKSTKYMHFVFHMFVLFGSIPHFIFVLLYCCR